MKSITFRIEREDILYQARLIAFYVGESRKNAATSDVATKMQASDENRDILGKFADSAAARMTDLMVSLLKGTKTDYNERAEEQNDGSTIAAHDITFSALVPNTFDDNQIQGITEGIRDAMIHYVVYRWFEMTNPAEAALYLKHFEENITDIRHRIAQRIKPVKRLPSPF